MAMELSCPLVRQSLYLESVILFVSKSPGLEAMAMRIEPECSKVKYSGLLPIWVWRGV